MKISVCIDALFSGKDFVESMRAVKASGINAFEFWVWWTKDLQQIKNAKEELGMELAGFCTKFVSLVDPSQRDLYLAGLKESIEAAKILGCKNLITQVGNEISGVSREEQHKSLVEGLKACVPILEKEGVTLLVEPLNITVDHKGYYLSSSAEAFEIIDEVASANVKVLFDIYHQQIMEGNLIANISNNIKKIGHFHAAGTPGRHELSTGEIDYPNVFKAIDGTGYMGFTGLEYFPIDDAVSELAQWR